jgi:catechol 2,3-dioxygenase-like lactoylglutathione lyase family enzyme
MIDIKGVAHFSIPVTDMDRSVRFYTDVVGCRELQTTGNGAMSFLDAGGVCVILCRQDTPVDAATNGPNNMHHSFIVDRATYGAIRDHLTAKGVAVEFEEDRQGGVVNGPRLYFRDPDGNALVYIDLPGYSGAPAKPKAKSAPRRRKAAPPAKRAPAKRAPSKRVKAPARKTARKPAARKRPASSRRGARRGTRPR